MPYPADRQYTKEHEWIKVDGNVGVVGITDHAQQSLGDIVFVELPKPGTAVISGQSFGTVESVKAVSDLFSPVTGAITEVNSDLANTPEQINKDPHGAWMVKIQLSDPAQVKGLLSPEDYQKYVAEES